MQVMAEAEIGPVPTPRRAARHQAAERATLNQMKLPPEPIVIVNISTDGCGFESRWPFQAGTRVWLQLPGLTSWIATVVWWHDGAGGLEFVQPLHPAVALRYARDIANEA